MSDRETQTLKTGPGRPATISLPVNRTTGFSWEVAVCDPALEYRELPFIRRFGAIGGGGVQRFEIHSLQTGEFGVRLVLKRPWETKVREERVYRIIVVKNSTD